MSGQRQVAAYKARTMPSDAVPVTDFTTDPKRKRFRPWNGLRRMFRRKSRSEGGSSSSGMASAPEGLLVETKRRGQGSGLVTTCIRSRSTSVLLDSNSPENKRRLHSDAEHSPTSPTVSAAYSAGLSVSHDSVFSPEPSLVSREHLDSSASSSSTRHLVMKGVQAELRSALKQRRAADTSEEDLGLPHSPCTSPMSTELHVSSYRGPNSVSQSTGSNGSFLSMGSFELEEDTLAVSGTVPINRTSTKMVRPIGDNDWDMESASVPLSHSAARHKMAVRPKKTRGASRTRQPQLANLPSTPEDIEYASAERLHSPILLDLDHSLSDLTPSVPDPVTTSKSKTSPTSTPFKESKVRSLSLSRAEQQASDSSTKSSNSSGSAAAAKLARSKSSADRKTSLEGIGTFWRLHRNKDKNKADGANSAVNPSLSEKDSRGSSPQTSNNKEVKRKELRKIKRDREEKKKLKENQQAALAASGDGSLPVDDPLIEDSQPVPAFFSRLFGSRRSSRKKKEETTTVTEDSNEPETGGFFSKLLDPKPSPKGEEKKTSMDHHTELEQEAALSSSGEDKGYESLVITPDMLLRTQSGRFAKPIENWDPATEGGSLALEVQSVPSPVSSAPPRFSAPQHQKRVVSDRSRRLSTERTSEETGLNCNIRYKSSDSHVDTRPKLNIAGLSPYQRRVARIGNELEISDDEMPSEDFTTASTRHVGSSTFVAPSRPPRRAHSFRQEELPADENEVDNLTSLPVDLHKDFILKKSPPYDEKSSARSSASSSEIQRSLETLKWSNEGLKKAIDSLHPCLSRSSEQLGFSDDSTKRSAESMSTGSSSLNISETDLEPMTPASSTAATSGESLDKSSLGLSGCKSTECVSLNGSETEKESPSPAVGVETPFLVLIPEYEQSELFRRDKCSSPARDVGEQHTRITDVRAGEEFNTENMNAQPSPPQIRFRIISKPYEPASALGKPNPSSMSDNNKANNTRMSSHPITLAARETSAIAAPASPEFLHVQLQKIELRNTSTNVVFETEKDSSVKGGISSSEGITKQPLKTASTTTVGTMNSNVNNEKPVFAVSVSVRNPPGFCLRSLSTPDNSLVRCTTTSGAVRPLLSPTNKTAQFDPAIHEANNRVLRKKDPSESKILPVSKSLSFDYSEAPKAKLGAKPWASDSSGVDLELVTDKVVEIIEEQPASEVVLRKRKDSRPNLSLSQQPPGNDDGSELMKVFARRSLKMKEAESEEGAVTTPTPDAKHVTDFEETVKKNEASFLPVAKPSIIKVNSVFKEPPTCSASTVTTGAEAESMTTTEMSSKASRLSRAGSRQQPCSLTTHSAILAEQQILIVEAPPAAISLSSPKQDSSGYAADQAPLSPVSRLFAEKVRSRGNAHRIANSSSQDETVIADIPAMTSSCNPGHVSSEQHIMTSTSWEQIARQTQDKQLVMPTTPIVVVGPTICIPEEDSADIVSDNGTSETAWKKQSPKPRISRLKLSIANDFSIPTVTEVAEERAEISRPVVPRQSKVLDMVNSFQRLQVT